MIAATKNFNPDTDPALVCTCGCGRHGVRLWALDRLQAIRDDVGRPLTVTSGYRCADHPDERDKVSPGQHHAGVAFDIAVSGGAERFELIRFGIRHGAKGIGVAKTFIHLDWRDGPAVAWEY